jgi:hypothetical protein
MCQANISSNILPTDALCTGLVSEWEADGIVRSYEILQGFESQESADCDGSKAAGSFASSIETTYI